MSAKRITSQDVAKQAGVSRTTVSLVLNDVQGIQISDETRQRVIAAARELGYVPDAAAQALASRRSHIIGLIMVRRTNQFASDAFFPQLLDGLIQVVHHNEMRLLVDIIDPQYQQEAYLSLVRAKRIDGMLLSGPRFDDQALKVLETYRFPAVIVGQLPGSSFPSVDVDNCKAAQAAVAHLIQLGHTRIGCITNAPLSYTAASDRLMGYRKALEAAGLPFDSSLVRYGEFDMDSGYQRMNSLLDSGKRITAMFAASDVVALGAQAALFERGIRVPQDMALVGFDDVPFAKYTNPPLTTIHLPAHELGWTAGELLIKMIVGEKLHNLVTLLDTQLIIRESCGAKFERKRLPLDNL